MKPSDLFNHIWSIDYDVSGFDLDYKVEVDKLDRKVRLIFKPSDSWQDWIVNILGFFPVFSFPFFFCFGWKKVFDGCKGVIMGSFLSEVRNYPMYGIEICGHSYGGAMSIIAGLETYEMTGRKADVITFGAPKPLFLYLSKMVASGHLGSVVQYEHRSDIVPFCPPFIGYHNVKSVKLGKFKFINLFKPSVYHMIYGDSTLYEEAENG